MRGRRKNWKFAALNQICKFKTYSSEDFERFYLCYKAEGMPRGTSIQAFCSKNKVPCNLFEKWYTDTRHRLVSVRVEGMPENNVSSEQTAQPSPAVKAITEHGNPLRIMIDLKMTDGLHLQQRNLSYEALKRMISNLEVLC